MPEWFRVSDPLSPLHGCDVRLGPETYSRPSGPVFQPVVAARRVDVFQGDRPYQRVAPAGQDLGIMVSVDSLRASPIQEDVIELATDRPYGDLIEEYQLDRSDGIALRVVVFTEAIQAALSDEDGSLVRSLTYTGPALQVRFELLEEAFNDGEDLEGLELIMVEAEG